MPLLCNPASSLQLQLANVSASRVSKSRALAKPALLAEHSQARRFAGRAKGFKIKIADE